MDFPRPDSALKQALTWRLASSSNRQSSLGAGVIARNCIEGSLVLDDLTSQQSTEQIFDSDGKCQTCFIHCGP